MVVSLSPDTVKLGFVFSKLLKMNWSPLFRLQGCLETEKGKYTPLPFQFSISISILNRVIKFKTVVSLQTLHRAKAEVIKVIAFMLDSMYFIGKEENCT